LRTVKARDGQGLQHEYLRLVESYREDGCVKQCVVINLGRKDLLSPHLDSLVHILQGERAEHGRVQVNLAWLQRWHRTLDELLEHKEEIEQRLYFQLCDLFSLQVELVFYDLTSTYFEGKGSKELGWYGCSRDGKRRNRQVQVGVVTVDGWLIAHHVFRVICVISKQ
jgi:hypothetical protein